MSFDRRRHALPGRRRPPTKTRFPGTSKVASHERESSICLLIRRASSLSTSLAGMSARSRYGIDFASANRRARSSSADPPCGEDGQLKLGGRRITAETILTGYITDAGLRNRRLRRSGWCGGDLQPAEDRAMIARIKWGDVVVGLARCGARVRGRAAASRGPLSGGCEVICWRWSRWSSINEVVKCGKVIEAASSQGTGRCERSSRPDRRRLVQPGPFRCRAWSAIKKHTRRTGTPGRRRGPTVEPGHPINDVEPTAREG